VNHQKTIASRVVLASLAIGGTAILLEAAPSPVPSSAPQTGKFVIDGAPVDMDLYHQVLARWGPDTGPELLVDYQKDLAEVKAIVDAGNHSKSYTAVEKFSHSYWPYDKDDVAALRREMKY